MVSTNFQNKIPSAFSLFLPRPKMSIKFHYFIKVYPILQIEKHLLDDFNSFIFMHE